MYGAGRMADGSERAKKIFFRKRQVRSDPSSEYHFTVACCPGFPVWTELWMPAAFVNYEVPVPLFLVYFIWTEELYRKKAEKYSCFQTFAVIPLGICVQLFSENITIIVAAYALWMLVYTAVRYRKIYLIEVNYLCSAILGAVLMFSNSAYSSAAVHNGKTYKSIDMSAGILLQRFAARIWTNLVLNNWVLTVIFTVLLTVLILKKRKQSFAAAEMLVVFWGYSAYSILHKICPEWIFAGTQAVDRGIMALLSIVFFINVILCVWMFTEKRRTAFYLYHISWFAGFAAPLIAADPIGPRCFYISYVFEVLAAVKILQYLLKREKKYRFLSGIDPCSDSLYFSIILCEDFYDNREVQ